MQVAIVVGLILVAFLLGGIPFGLLIARMKGIRDIRQHGSGNIGATNVWRVLGPKAAFWVYMFDISKGALAVGLARLVDQTVIPRETLLVLVAVAAVLGHVFSPYLGFKGGKGVNTGLGVMIMLLPLEVLVSFVIFVIVVAASRFISLGSIVAAVALCVLILVERELLIRDVAPIYLFLAIALALVVVITHRRNIERIFAGTENRFSLSTKRPQTGARTDG